MKIKLNGLTMNYQERGLPQGLPVIFIHGFPFDHTMWESQMMALPQEYRAISYDVRGHGQSDVADGQYSIEFFVDDLVDLMDHLGLKKAVLCGLSMGGYIALRATERHPNRVKALILCDTRSEADANEAKVKRANQIKAVKTGGVKPFAEGFIKAVFAPQTIKENPVVVESIRTVIESTSPLAICGTLLALAARTDTTDSLPAINAPTMILVGEHDALTPPSASRSMHERIRSSSLHVVPHATHLSNLENRAFFNEKLLAFLKSVPKP
ncbi:MAG: alpha/beta fold hydrolase [Ignavibacteriales bacterium]|nr:alpha/beta fold hydrolase [Ignavibacteriales bacterium]